jgi:hypothetical protein
MQQPQGGAMTQASNTRLHNRHGNFTLVPNAFVESGVSHESFRLYVVLLSYAKGSAMDGGDVFPSYDTLKEKARIKSYSTIAKCLRELVSSGWLERKKRFGASTIYTLTSPTPGVVMEADTVLRGVESITTPGVGQSYTPSKTNKTQVTKPKEQDPEEEERAQETQAASPPPTSPLWSDERVAAYSTRFKKTPTLTNAKIIVSRIQAADIELWREVLRAWGERGWSGTNIAGMCERYDAAVIARQAAAEKVPAGAQAGKIMSDAEYQALMVSMMRGEA